MSANGLADGAVRFDLTGPATYTYRGKSRAVPTAPYTFTAAVQLLPSPLLASGMAQGFAIGLIGTDGKVFSLNHIFNVNTWVGGGGCGRWAANGGSWVATDVSATWPVTDLCFLRIVDTGSRWQFAYSSNGLTWFTFYDAAYSWMTPANIFLAGYDGNANEAYTFILKSLAVTTP